MSNKRYIISLKQELAIQGVLDKLVSFCLEHGLDAFLNDEHSNMYEKTLEDLKEILGEKNNEQK